MALNISSYTDPGVIIGETITPAAISIATVPDVLALVSHGNRSKRAINEAVVRGQVSQEALTVAGSPPHTATLVNVGDRRVSNTTIRRTLFGAETVVPDALVSYPAATVTGSSTETFDVSINNALGLSIDGKQPITMTFTDGASAVVVTDTLIAVTTTLAGAGATASAAEIVAGINAGLSDAASTALGYGPAYGAVASAPSTSVVLTSPVTTPASDIKVLAVAGLDAATELGFITPLQAGTLVQIDAAYWDVAATWEIDYVANNTDLDSLLNTSAIITRVGSFANVTSFTTPLDYQLTTGDIDWSPDAPATISATAETYDISTNDLIKLAFDGKASIEIDLNGLVSPPLDYANPSSPAAATAAELALNINAVLSTAANYGPEYAAVATDVGGVLTLTSFTSGGSTSSIEISAPTSLSAITEIFGLLTSQLPYTKLGTGSRPVVGVIYFTTYEYARASADYNTPKRFFSEDAMLQDLGPVSVENVLSTYGQIAYDNGAPSIFVSQVDDTTAGFPTVNEITAAIDGLEQSSLITDVLTTDTRINVQTYLLAHIENQSSPTEKNFRSGWFGMPIGTKIGDKDTPDTFVYRAAVTLQVAPDSPARGRLLLVAPTGVQRTIVLEDGTETTLTMDSTAVACAAAARHTSFTSPIISLASKNITGFDINTFPTFIKSERAQLASNGVFIITNDGGRLSILDPVTTEGGGGRLIKFLFRSATSQKDNVSRQVTRVVDTNLRGIVPEDLADFIFDIKIFVGSTIVSLIENGAIGPFRDANGVSRDIDLSRDIQAEQSRSDPTKFFFRYFYFLRYPALRFQGEFSTDNPFFSN